MKTVLVSNKCYHCYITYMYQNSPKASNYLDFCPSTHSLKILWQHCDQWWGNMFYRGNTMKNINYENMFRQIHHRLWKHKGKLPDLFPYRTLFSLIWGVNMYLLYVQYWIYYGWMNWIKWMKEILPYSLPAERARTSPCWHLDIARQCSTFMRSDAQSWHQPQVGLIPSSSFS